MKQLLLASEEIANVVRQAQLKKVVELIKQNSQPIVTGWEGKNKIVGRDLSETFYQALLKEAGLEK